ncbi:MAG: heavy-metal-associated domain-containing protein [Flavobacteriales bacterium]|nr:heavy-metal-associated domain-containing protein [Flavobacteriales bacterium]MCB9174139.1 heavy-metal-associated domain-containing protein [Flavobacteriales bacterium]
MKTEIKIEGLSCGHCVNAVSTILKNIEGVEHYQVSLPDVALIEFNENKVSLEKIKQEINDSEIYKAI